MIDQKREEELKACQQRLAHASGALADIYGLVSSSIGVDDLLRVHEVARSVVQRILLSADCVRTRPSWCRHPWEKRLWDQYEAGELLACGTDSGCMDEATRLVASSPRICREQDC